MCVLVDFIVIDIIVCLIIIENGRVIFWVVEKFWRFFCDGEEVYDNRDWEIEKGS